MGEACRQCGELLNSAEERDHHRKSVHEPERWPPPTTAQGSAELWPCPLCGETLASPTLRQAHSVRPHFRSNRTIPRTARYWAA